MILKQLIKYDNAPALEVTWVDEADVVVKCHAYSAGQMDMLRADLGADAAQFEALIAEIEATYIPPEPTPLADRQNAAWELIKTERDRRKHLPVKVGTHWFHSDDSSRIQQTALARRADRVEAIGGDMTVPFPGPGPGSILLWKSISGEFIPMTPLLAQQIFDVTFDSDIAIFAAAEVHRLMMRTVVTPETYDYKANWPESIEDIA